MAFSPMADALAFRLAPGKNNLRQVPNFYLRCLKELRIEFTPKKRSAQ